MTEKLKPIDVSKYHVTEDGNVLKQPDNRTELEKENTKLKDKNRHDCPNCPAFGIHCPHKINGDPYFYDCYLTVVELENENAEAKEIIRNFLLWENSWHEKTESKYALLKLAEDFIKE